MTNWNKITTDVVHWLCRDFESHEQWKAAGRAIFLETAGCEGVGDSNDARRKLAERIKNHVEELDGRSVHVENWDAGMTEIVSIELTPPSSATDVAWESAAAYILLAARCDWKERDEENDRRRKVNNGLERKHKKELKTNTKAPPPELISFVGYCELAL